MNQVRRLILLSAAGLLISIACQGQAAPGKKEYTFHGKVEAVNKAAQNLSVNGEKVEGWMAAMTMNYKVDDPTIFDKVKAGDQIAATVYDGDYTLHKIRIMGKNTEDSKSKK